MNLLVSEEIESDTEEDIFDISFGDTDPVLQVVEDERFEMLKLIYDKLGKIELPETRTLKWFEDREKKI
jgi:hypothetical protein